MIRYEIWLNSLVTHEQMERDLFVESPLAHPSVIARRQVLLDAEGYREMDWPEDYDLWLRLFAAGVRFAKVPRHLYWWRERTDRLSRTSPAYSPASFRACKVHHLRSYEPPGQMHLAGRNSVAVWGAGKEGKALARHLVRNGIRITRFVDIDPRKIGGQVLGAPVVPPEELTREEYLLVAVGAPGARAQIRQYLDSRGWQEPEDYRTMV